MKISDFFIIRWWYSVSKQAPPTDTALFLKFDDGSIDIGEYMPDCPLVNDYQPFGDNNRGIFTCSEKVIKWSTV